MEWRRETDTNIRSGNFSIARTGSAGSYQYTLWLCSERIATFNSADEAKAAAADRYREELAGAA